MIISKRKAIITFLFLFIILNFSQSFSIENDSIIKSLNSFKITRKDFEFEKMLRSSQIKGKKDLYDESLIYNFLSAKYPALRASNIEKKIRKTSFNFDNNEEKAITLTGLLNQYKKNPSLLSQEYFKKQIREYWQNKNFNNIGDEKLFLENFGRILTTNDYEIKLEKILWSGDAIKAKNLKNILSKVSQSSRLKAKDRLDIQSSENIDDLFRRFNKLDNRLNDDNQSRQILLFDTIKWCEKRNLNDEAIKLLEIIPLKDRIENDKWMNLVKPILRFALTTKNTKNYNIAYKIASNHGIVPGKIEYVEMEFFAGFIASEFLNQKSLALTHFIHSYKNAKQDFRKARGAYWIGKMYKALESQNKGNKEFINLKNKYFLIASQEFTTFYGQLSLKELNNLEILKKYFVKTSSEDLHSIMKHPIFKYYYLSLMSKNVNLSKKIAKIFVLSLKSKNEITIAAQIANALHMPEISVYMGNIAMYNMNLVVLEALYPVLYYKHLTFHKPLNLAIIKRESNFDRNLISWADAYGMMQIIPKTALEIAEKLGDKRNDNYQFLLNPHINVQYGNFWLQHLAKKYNSSEILIAAAYNAGSGSVAKWIRLLGDPREKNISTLNWVEQIPFRETRYYVQSVLSTMMIYQAMINYD
jgi:soluble lytic murein transglycosylase